MKIVKFESFGLYNDCYLVNDIVRFYPEQQRAWVIEGGKNIEDYKDLVPYFTAKELTVLQLKFGPLVNPTQKLYESFLKFVEADRGT